MKKRYLNNMKSIALSFCILAGLLFPMIFSFLDISNYNMNSIENSDDTFIYSLNGKNYLAKYITENDLNDLKNQGDVREKRSNYSIIIDGHGTGFAPPTEKDSEKLIGKIKILEVLEDSNLRDLKASHDLSTEIYFPAVGDQQSQGSCGAWASVYYAYGYLEAKDYGWNAKSGDPQYLMSPAWTYNKVAAYDSGSWMIENGQILKEWGCATMDTMPYDDSDVNSWGNEEAWREAPYHRAFDAYLLDFNESNPTTTIDMIKSLVQGGTPVTFALDAYQFYPGLEDNFIISSSEYNSSTLNHAQCIVGFDDSITEDGDTGAFRVVNSWGEDFYLMDGGFYWLTYDALIEIGMTLGDWGIHLCVIEDIPDHLPDLIATWEFNPAPTRMQDIITLGVGPHDTPLDYTIPWYEYDDGYVFPDFMAFDISDFYTYYTIDNDVFFFLEIGPSDTTGTISSFKLERYLGGVLQEISKESIDVPKDTPGYVNATFKIFLHELRVTLDVPNNPIIYDSYQIKAMVINNGISNETAVYFELLLDSLSVDSMIISSLPSGANATINYSWTPTEYNVYNFTAQTPPISGEIYTSNNIATEILCIFGPIFYDDFESGLSKWVSITGLWHLTDGSSAWPDPYHSPIHSMWFGSESTGTYETGYREIGNITSIPIDLTGADEAFLEFYHWREGEGFGYDVSYVYITINGVTWDLIYQSSTAYIAPWEKVSIDISAYTGNPSVQLMFNFDTIDDLYNYYRGWLIDDVAIMGTGVVIPHDLRVSLEIPENPEVTNSYTINATVTNIGANDETSVDFYLYLNGIEVDSLSIPNLLVGITQTISYSWTPTEYGVYNFTAYAPPVSGEEFIYDNLVTEIVELHEIMLFDGMFIEHTYTEMGYAGGPSGVSYSQISELIFHVEWEVYSMGMLYQGYWDVDSHTRVMQNSGGNAYFGDNFHTPFWIFPDALLGDTIPIAVLNEGDHIFNITGDFLYDLPGFGLVDVWILEDLTLPGGIAWYEKSTGILLYGDFYLYGGLYNYIFDFVDTNAPFEYIIFDHDLKVYLETPISNKINETYVINATVKNNGLNDETNVELFLYLDELPVASMEIPTLNVGMEETIQYIWTPTEYGTYNFTAYTPAVPLESYVENNRKTTFVYLFETELFDGLYVKHLYSEYIYTFNTNFTYTPYTSRLYYETWNIEFMGMTMTYTWIVDALTRVTSGGSLFGDGAHTPAWIFTNTSLYETIPIAVDGEGDHDFYVARELTYDLPGFGLVEVWELEDLSFPGGIAWYEKSTGILLNGIFFYYGGISNYTFDFIDTNAELQIVEPPTLAITTPDSTSSWETETSEDIIWTSIGIISDVKIELYKDDAFVMEIVASTPNDGSYTWAIPSGLEDSVQYQIKISDASNPSIYDYSEYFEITTPAIPGYDPLILIGITGICVIILIKIRSRKELKIK